MRISYKHLLLTAAMAGAIAAGAVLSLQQEQGGGTLLVGMEGASMETAAKAVQHLGKIESKDGDHGMFQLALHETVSVKEAKAELAKIRSVKYVLPSRARSVDMVSIHSVRDHIAYLRAKAKLRDGEKYDPEAAGVDYLESWEFYLSDRVGPDGTIDADAYRRAVAHREQMPPAQMGGGTGLAPNGSWTYVGPRNLDIPYQTYYGQRPIIGRVNAIAYDSSNANRIYIASAQGGIWKSENGGTTWIPLNDDWDHLHTSAIAVDPNNSNVLYAGTGDWDGGPPYTMGLMKSTDGGTTWTQLGMSDFPNSAIRNIAIDPDNSNIVTIATGKGSASGSSHVWRSTNGGTTWSKPINVGANWSDVQIGVPGGGGVRTYWAVGSGGSGGRVYKSTTQGASWTPLSLPAGLGSESAIDVAASKLDPDTAYVLCGQNRKIYKTTTGGSGWTDVTAGFPNGSGNYNWSQGWYDFHIGTSTVGSGPGAEDAVYVGLITIAMSPDGGSTWKDLGVTYTNGAKTHNDQHSFAAHPTDRTTTLIGNDGGVFRSVYNEGAGTASFTGLNTVLGITQFYKMALHPTRTDWILGGTQDNASPAALGDLMNWDCLYAGDGGFCAINHVNTNIQYTTSQNLSIYRTTNAWSNFNTISPSTGSDRKAFIAPIQLGNDPTNLFAGTNYLWKYNGSSWTPRLGGQELSASSSVRIIATCPSDDNRLYTGAPSGEAWTTPNLGTSWSQINTGTTSLPNRTVTSISPSPTTATDVVVGVSGFGTGHVWRCTNVTLPAGSRQWINVSGTGGTGLPDVPVNALARDPHDPEFTWYAGTDVGVFMTTDSGATWSNMTEPLGLPNVQVNDLKVHASGDWLYAATYGRGIWRIGLVGTLPALSQLTANPGQVVGGETSIGTVHLTANAPGGGIEVTLTDNTSLIAIPPSVTVPAGASTADFAISTTNSFGTYVRQVFATYNGVTKAVNITITPSLQAVGVHPNQVIGGASVTGTVVLYGAAPPGGTTVTLFDNSSAVGTPASVVVPAGANFKQFTITTSPVGSTVTRQVFATLAGLTKGTNLTLTPGLKSVSVHPTSIQGGNWVTGFVSLLGPSGPGGTPISITDNSAAISAPPSVTVPAGALWQSFTVNTTPVAVVTVGQISASAAGVTKVTNLTVNP